MAYAQAAAQKNWALVSYSFSNQHFFNKVVYYM
jgi:hypothetical protein